MIRSVIKMCTQRDADTRVGIGAYTEALSSNEQTEEKQQFVLGDTRSLDAIIRELVDMGHIVSFCTAGYRCGRTGKKIMEALESGREGCFCKLNAVLTFQEWLEDFASPETYHIGTQIIEKEMSEIKARVPKDFSPSLWEHLVKARNKILERKRSVFLGNKMQQTPQACAFIWYFHCNECGKSSLLNHISGQSIVIVSETGTTSDAVRKT